MTELDNRESEAANERNGSYLQDQSPPGPEEHLLLEDSDSDTRIAAKLRLQGIHIGAGLIAPRVFWPALIIIVAVTLTAILAPTFTEVTLQALQTWIVETLGWYYVLVVAVFILFSLEICFSKYGKVTLGRDGDRPEFGLLTWFCMLFAAGMGIGLVFYG
jgi:choline/glycine/proline betaine transport protein